MIAALTFGVVIGWLAGIATVFGVVAFVYRKGIRGC